ncbi:hypothetical protein [Bacillus marinisedimentorum]|uniref:hypothetical protein n=1 Tax=Bacillus marinisedimentorum TaxID=1821260 RepID=UPI0014725B10|nr:hypothetical protein [Bacillus marinisedimentorum]
MDAIKVGPFVIKYLWMILAASFAAGYFTLQLTLRKKDRQHAADWLNETLNAAVIWFAIWKLSYIILHPVSAVSNPISILYFTGGSIGAWLGIAGAVLFMRFRLNKMAGSLPGLLYEYLLAVLAGTGVYHLLALFFEEAMYHGFQAALAVLLALYLLRKKKDIAWQVLLWFSIGQVAAGFLHYRDIFLFMFSLQQWVFLSLSLYLLLKDKDIKE